MSASPPRPGPWRRGPSLAVPLKYHKAMADTAAGRLLVFGGVTVDAEAPTRISGAMYEFRLADSRWVPIELSVVGRYNHAACMLGGKAYIFGGGSLGQQEQAELLEVAVAGGRAEAAVLPRGPARQGHSMVPWAGRLVVFGGTDGKQYYSDCWSFQVDNGVWTHQHPGGCGPDVPPPRAYHSCVVEGHTMTIFGGGDREVEFADCWQLDLETFCWHPLPPQGDGPAARKGHVAWIHTPTPPAPTAGDGSDAPGPTMFVFGGCSSRLHGCRPAGDVWRYFGDVWALGLTSRQWRPVSLPTGAGQRVKAASEPREWSYHAACVVGDQAYCIGGGYQDLLSDSLWLFDCAAARDSAGSRPATPPPKPPPPPRGQTLFEYSLGLQPGSPFRRISFTSEAAPIEVQETVVWTRDESLTVEDSIDPTAPPPSAVPAPAPPAGRPITPLTHSASEDGSQLLFPVLSSDSDGEGGGGGDRPGDDGAHGGMADVPLQPVAGQLAPPPMEVIDVDVELLDETPALTPPATTESPPPLRPSMSSPLPGPPTSLPTSGDPDGPSGPGGGSDPTAAGAPTPPAAPPTSPSPLPGAPPTATPAAAGPARKGPPGGSPRRPPEGRRAHKRPKRSCADTLRKCDAMTFSDSDSSASASGGGSRRTRSTLSPAPTARRQHPPGPRPANRHATRNTSSTAPRKT